MGYVAFGEDLLEDSVAASLPAPGATPSGQCYLVYDANSTTDCTVGLAGGFNLCCNTGSQWVALASWSPLGNRLQDGTPNLLIDGNGNHLLDGG
jgi:hypothetical protein